jgi:hypothetical protein
MSTNSRTSRERSPIRPTTTTSATVWRVIRPSSTDLPTPEPAIRPTRWPLPRVSMELMARTPTSSGSVTGFFFSGWMRGGCDSSGKSPVSLPRPSIGSPRPLTMRPSQPEPICKLTFSGEGSTRAPVVRPTAFLNGIRKESLSRKPTTWASSHSPLTVSIWQRWPVCKGQPTASSSKPDAPTRRPVGVAMGTEPSSRLRKASAITLRSPLHRRHRQPAIDYRPVP